MGLLAARIFSFRQSNLPPEKHRKSAAHAAGFDFPRPLRNIFESPDSSGRLRIDRFWSTCRRASGDAREPSAAEKGQDGGYQPVRFEPPFGRLFQCACCRALEVPKHIKFCWKGKCAPQGGSKSLSQRGDAQAEGKRKGTRRTPCIAQGENDWRYCRYAGLCGNRRRRKRRAKELEGKSYARYIVCRTAFAGLGAPTHCFAVAQPEFVSVCACGMEFSGHGSGMGMDARRRQKRMVRRCI